MLTFGRESVEESSESGFGQAVEPFDDLAESIENELKPIQAPTFAVISGQNNFRLDTYLEPVFLEFSSSGSSLTELDYQSSSVGSDNTLHELQQSIPISYDFSEYTNALLQRKKFQF